MRLGFHISISGGLSRVVSRAVNLGCETIQFFSRNPRRWQESLITPEEIKKFKKNLHTTTIAPIFLHTPYLLNLASFDKNLHFRSLNLLCDELKQAQKIGARFVIIHFGYRLQVEEKKAIKQVAKTINTSLKKVKNSVQILIENTAGQGTEIGYKICQFRELLNQIENQERLGICFDTAHGFAAGYNLANPSGLEQMLEEFDHLIGLKNLKLLHLNDSRFPLGSKKDRHWHIGQGEIGYTGFANIVNHPFLSHLPGILETPRKNDWDDLSNIKIIRQLMN
ncbi:MAG: deoxyribonuclease IV [Desulfobacterota bacterium]|nr:deoxyribonuclease IV [Thermodesulfobacteriota bacterium]